MQYPASPASLSHPLRGFVSDIRLNSSHVSSGSFSFHPAFRLFDSFSRASFSFPRGGPTQSLWSVGIVHPGKDGVGLMDEFKNSNVVSAQTTDE